MKKKQLISLESLEYEVYKNEAEINKPKLITLDGIFNITIIPKKKLCMILLNAERSSCEAKSKNNISVSPL
jgi:hypothetical protein